MRHNWAFNLPIDTASLGDALALDDQLVGDARGLGEGERAPAGGECEVVDVCLPPPPSAEMPEAE